MYINFFLQNLGLYENHEFTIEVWALSTAWCEYTVIFVNMSFC